jgi:hypothetical protein
MKKMNRLALSVLLLVAPAMFAQANSPAKAAQSIDRPAEPNLVFDDDGGKAQIVPQDLSVTEKTFHGGEVMKSAQQVSIFLGSPWADQSVRVRQTALLDLGATQAAHLADLKKNNVHTLTAAPSTEDFTDLANAHVNDLTIQRKLSDLLESKAIPAPSPTTIYVVYLAPGISSSLGVHKAGIDYAAYHNFVHLEAGEIRYVVVPFHDSADRHSAVAARAFAETALNPNGTGWY